jgi:hypothetical protein
MPYTTAGKNAMLDHLRSLITHVVAYDGDPQAAGVELDRQAIAFSAAAGGAIDSSNQPALNIGAGETVSFLGYINANDADALLAVQDVTNESFANAGTYTITDADLDLNAA